MNLYLIQTTEKGYDTYDSFVVNEKNDEEAKKWHPSSYDKGQKTIENYPHIRSITLIGKSIKDSEKGCVIASFNAG